MRNNIWLAVTPGDPEGIGPEIVARVIREKLYPKHTRLVIVGALEPLRKLGVRAPEIGLSELKRIRESSSASAAEHVWLIDAPKAPAKCKSAAGFRSGWSIETATRLVLDQTLDALVTGPISKSRINAAGYRYPGHTEFLARLCKAPHVTMMLANDQLRVSLVTGHLPLKKVSAALSRTLIRKATLQTAQSLQRLWGIRKPKIAVLGLNPHAGEGGLLGSEETRITAELRSLRKNKSFVVQGPFSADTFFALNQRAPKKERYDAVVCMYHDQALIPVKLLDFGKTVNITLGLPIIRTSVDHGTGFDIVGTGKADPSSLQEAIRLADQLAHKVKT